MEQPHIEQKVRYDLPDVLLSCDSHMGRSHDLLMRRTRCPRISCYKMTPKRYHFHVLILLLYLHSTGDLNEVILPLFIKMKFNYLTITIL